MDDKALESPSIKPSPSRKTLREARLKTALKANLARRKSQAKARNGDGGQEITEPPEKTAGQN